MMKVYILAICFLLSFSFVAAASLDEEVSILEWKIAELTVEIDMRAWDYSEEIGLLERKFIIERQRELSDCSERWVSCISSQAEKKYQTLFDELEAEYTLDIAPWQEEITAFREEIKALQQEELDRQQRLLDEQTNINGVPWFGTDIFSDEDNEKIAAIHIAIANAQWEKQKVTDTYEVDLKDLEERFTIERQSELDDCERRSISCSSSFAKRKYEPLYEQLEQKYFEDIFVWTEAIRDLEQQIEDIKTKQTEKNQELISNRTDQEVLQDEQISGLIEQSELDYEKAQGYFENKSYANAAIFYAKSCSVEYAKLFLCYNGLAWSHENLNNLEEALDAYKLALEYSYTQEDIDDIQKSITRISSRITLSKRLTEALDNFIVTIDKKFEGKELIFKRRFYDDIILSVTNKRKSITNEETLKLFDVAIDAFRDARQFVEQEINDLYN